MSLLLVSALILADPVKPEPLPYRIENGRWAERGEDGSSGCGDPQARNLDVYYLTTPPHAQSPNSGDIHFDLGSTGTRYILTSVPQLSPPDEDGQRLLTMTGGIVHTIGIELYGVLSSFTRGRMEASFRLDPAGGIHLQSLTFTDRNRAPEIAVADGRMTQTGEALRAFEHCADSLPED